MSKKALITYYLFMNSTIKKYLIVSADDFGLTKGINQAIINAYNQGILTSTSFLINGFARDEAIELIKSYKNIDVGLHLTITQGLPLLKPEYISSIIKNGTFFYPNYKKLFLKMLLKKVNIKDIEKEFRKQLDFAFNAGLNISHIDTHQHIHPHPSILNLIIKLAIEYNIKAVRLPFLNPLSSLKLIFNKKIINNLTKILVYPLKFYTVKKLSQYKITFPDSLIGYYFTGQLNEKNLLTSLENIKTTFSELICHPSIHQEHLSLIFPGGYRNFQWQAEYHALISEKVKNKIKELNIKLINFKDLIRLKSSPNSISKVNI